MDGTETVADEEPVIQDCMVSHLSGRPRAFLLSEKDTFFVVRWGGGGVV
jgi:hypothetical protein